MSTIRAPARPRFSERTRLAARVAHHMWRIMLAHHMWRTSASKPHLTFSAYRTTDRSAYDAMSAYNEQDSSFSLPGDAGAMHLENSSAPSKEQEALVVSGQDRERAQVAYHDIFQSGSNGLSEGAIKSMLLANPYNLALLRAAGSAWTFGSQHERVAEIVATLPIDHADATDTASSALAAPPVVTDAGGMWDLLNSDTQAMLLETMAKRLLFVDSPPDTDLPADSFPYSGQALKIGELRSPIDFGFSFYSEKAISNTVQAYGMINPKFFEDIATHTHVDVIMTQLDPKRITAEQLRLCEHALAPAYRVYQIIKPTAPEVDFTNSSSIKSFVTNIRCDTQNVGMRVHIATIVEQQHALTVLRSVCKEWRDFYRKHMFLPHVDPLTDMGNPDELEGYAERLPFANQRSIQRVGFCMRRVGCGNKFEYLPASLVWNLAKSITVGTDTLTSHGQWERLGPGGVEMTNSFVKASRAFKSFKIDRDKTMPVVGYRMSAEHGSRPRFTLSHKPDPWFNASTLVTLMYYRMGAIDVCTKGTVERPHSNMQHNIRFVDRYLDRLLYVQRDISIPFNFLKTGGKQAGGKSKAAPMRVRLEFELHGGATLHCSQEDPFYILWCNLTKQKRMHLKRSRSEAAGGAQ